MVNDKERLLNQIGRLLAAQGDGSSAKMLLHAEVDTNMVGSNLFIERNDYVQYLWADDGFTYLILDLWEEDKPGERWAQMEYVLRDGKFDVTFIYPGEFDAEEDRLDRRRRVIRRHFGDQPVVYPSLDDDDDDDDAQRFDL